MREGPSDGTCAAVDAVVRRFLFLLPLDARVLDAPRNASLAAAATLARNATAAALQVSPAVVAAADAAATAAAAAATAAAAAALALAPAPPPSPPRPPATPYDAAVDAAWWAVPLLLAAASVASLVYGRPLFRPLAATAAGVAALALLYNAPVVDALGCVGRLVVSGVAALSALALVACLLRAGLFVLGAGAFGVATHFAYEAVAQSLPEDSGWDDGVGPEVFGRPATYWGAVGLMGVAGGAIAHRGRRQVLVVLTSVAGGAGLAASLALLAAGPPDAIAASSSPSYPRAGGATSASVLWAWIGLGGAAAVAGVVVQTRRERRRTRPPERRPGDGPPLRPRPGVATDADDGALKK